MFSLSLKDNFFNYSLYYNIKKEREEQIREREREREREVINEN